MGERHFGDAKKRLADRVQQAGRRQPTHRLKNTYHHAGNGVHDHFVQRFGVIGFKDIVNLFESVNSKSGCDTHSGQINELSRFGMTWIYRFGQHAFGKNDKCLYHIVRCDSPTRLQLQQLCIMDINGRWSIGCCTINVNFGHCLVA